MEERPELRSPSSRARISASRSAWSLADSTVFLGSEGIGEASHQTLARGYPRGRARLTVDQIVLVEATDASRLPLLELDRQEEVKEEDGEAGTSNDVDH